MSRILKNKTDFKSAFHKKLFSLLKNNVTDWAKKINVSKSTIRDAWFKNESYPRADNIIKICEEADVSADWLLLGKTEEIGSLKKGAFADIAVFELKSGEFKFQDSEEEVIIGSVHIDPKQTVQNGRVVWQKEG